MGFLGLDNGPKRLDIEHVDCVAPMRDLHRWGVLVTIADDDLDAESLKLDHDFFTELPAAAQQDAGCRASVGGADRRHSVKLRRATAH